MKNDTVIMERSFQAPIEKVWQAITDKDEMREWYFDIAEFRPEVGFEFRFSGRSEGKEWIQICRITEVIPLKKLQYTWSYQGYPGTSMVTFELSEKAGSTHLRLTHAGIANIGGGFPFKKEDFAGGWNQIINESLQKYLDGKG